MTETKNILLKLPDEWIEKIDRLVEEQKKVNPFQTRSDLLRAWIHERIVSRPEE